MNRFRFLSLIGLGAVVARAQQTLPVPHAGQTIPNGQCPIPSCGTMAPKYVRTLFDAGYANCRPTNNTGMTCDVITRYDGPESRRIDCERCGVTFRQWAEDLKK